MKAAIVLRIYYEQYKWRTSYLTNPWTSTKTAFTRFQHAVKLLFKEIPPDGMQRAAKWIKDNGYDIKKRELVSKVLQWVDKGAGKTVIKIRIIDETRILYENGYSSVTTLCEYVGGENLLEEIVGTELIRLCNQLLESTFTDEATGVRLCVRFDFSLLDHSAGCGLYKIPGVKCFCSSSDHVNV